MGGSSEMKWNKFTGTITKGELVGTVELIEGTDEPTWMSAVNNPIKGWQVSKNFKDLEKAHEWCVLTIEKE